CDFSCTKDKPTGVRGPSHSFSFWGNTVLTQVVPNERAGLRSGTSTGACRDSETGACASSCRHILCTIYARGAALPYTWEGGGAGGYQTRAHRPPIRATGVAQAGDRCAILRRSP